MFIKFVLLRKGTGEFKSWAGTIKSGSKISPYLNNVFMISDSIYCNANTLSPTNGTASKYFMKREETLLIKPSLF